MATIPTRIFQTWKSKTVDNPVMRKWQESWTKHNPTYSYELWDDEDNRNFIKENYPEFLEIYDSYPRNIQRADVIRYFYLYHYGGIYADLDFECLKSFDVFTMANDADVDVVLGSMDFISDKAFFHSIPNALMLAKPRSDFFLFLMNTLKNIGINKDLEVETSTGPVFLKLCFLKYIDNGVDKKLITSIYGKNIFESVNNINIKSKILVLPEYVFYPLSWDKKDNDEEAHTQFLEKAIQEPKTLFPNSFAITYWMHSWGEEKQQTEEKK